MDSGAVNHFSAPRNAVGTGLLAAAQYFCKSRGAVVLGTGKRLKRSQPQKRETGTPVVNAEEKQQHNRRAPETGDTASCGGTRAGIYFVQNKLV